MLLNFSSENAEALKSKFYDIAFLLKGRKLGFQIADLESGGDSLLQVTIHPIFSSLDFAWDTT